MGHDLNYLRADLDAAGGHVTRIPACTRARQASFVAVPSPSSIAMLQQLRFFSRVAGNSQVFLHEKAGKFLANLSPNPDSLAIGHSPYQKITPSTFQTNAEFLRMLHQNIGESVHHDFTFIMEAGVNALTYMPIYDLRETPKYSRIPNVDDIFGYVLVDNGGKIVPGTYEPNALYRLCNGSGLLKLSDYLHERMVEATRVK